MSAADLGSLRAVIDDLVTAIIDPADAGAFAVAVRTEINRLHAVEANAVHLAIEAEAWRASGATSVEAWFANETHSTMRDARNTVDLADTLHAAPAVAEAMANGQLSVDNAHALTPIVHHPKFADDADLLLEIASGSPRDTRAGVERWQAITDPKTEAERENELNARRGVVITKTDNGMVDIHAILTRDAAQHVVTALDHLAGAAFDDQSGRTHAQRLADGLVDLCQAYNAGAVAGGRERPTVLALVPFETIVERAELRGVNVNTSDTISANEARRLACDAEIHRLITKGRSIVLDLGMSVRVATDSQYLALAARDRGCRWPGCERPPGWCEAHHINEVVRDLGLSDMDNFALFCCAHHTMIHSRQWNLRGNAHTLTIDGPNGIVLDAPIPVDADFRHESHQLALV